MGASLFPVILWGCLSGRAPSDSSRGESGSDTAAASEACECDCTCTAEDVQSALDEGPVDLAAGSTVDSETILTAEDAISWSQLIDVPEGFADNEDNDALMGLSCGEGESPQADSAGTWRCVALEEAESTPTGTRPVLDSLIETDERGGDIWVNAILACDAIGRRLCTGQELIAACSLGILNDATDDTEWTGELSTGGFAMVVLGSTCTSTTTGAFAAAHAYRCCQN